MHLKRVNILNDLLPDREYKSAEEVLKALAR